jgi:hypothetical protein
MQDLTDEKIGKILFSEEAGDEEQLPEGQRLVVNELRRLTVKIREMLEFDPTAVEPAKVPLPGYLRARLERELETALRNVRRCRLEKQSFWSQCANQLSIRQWTGVALALLLCLLVPLALWSTSNRDADDYSIKSTVAGGKFPTVLLTPGAETRFTTPRVIWFSSKQRSARVSIRSLDVPTREWVSENRGGELAWSDFSPSEPLDAGKEYRLDILVDGKSVVARKFKISSSAIPLEIQGNEDPTEILSAAQKLWSEGHPRDALMRLGSVTDSLRRQPELRELRGTITAVVLAEEKE